MNASHQFSPYLASAADLPQVAPQAPHPYVPQIRLYQNWLKQNRGIAFDHYQDLWQWSITDLDTFWQSIWDYFAMQSPTPHSAVLAKNAMPGAVWFPGAQVNYAQQVLRHVDAAHAAGFPALIAQNEKGQHQEISWPELKRQVASMALHLKAQGLKPGDRVAAYLPNIPEAIVAFLATVSVGGVWSICAPDMGTLAVLDRFKQIEPKVLIACDGVTYGAKDYDRMTVVQELKDALPSVQHVILHDNLGVADLASNEVAAAIRFSQTTSKHGAEVDAFAPMDLPFDHPLWIVYSSGTTGLPKPIVHGHGGTVIVALALKILHNDVGCSYHPNSWGERFHWYSSTGWVMWNAQVGGLMNGTTCVIYDGNPGGSKDNPDWSTLWRFAADNKVTFFGAGAAFFANCQKANVDLTQCGDLSRIRALGTTGSPLSADTQTGVLNNLNASRLNTRTHRIYTVKQMATFGGATFPAAPTFAAPSLVATESCHKKRASCNVVCWAVLLKHGTKRANLCMAKWVSWCVRSPFRQCLCIFGTIKTMRATWRVILKCIQQAMAESRAVAMRRQPMVVCGDMVIGCALVPLFKARTAVKVA